ncbi:recombinase family protein [Lacrimispora sp. BS-2]|uniref:Recombinase family protein n=1 Tax=Lacrimispora sp. BS-2 TaxID=3151850 RepID=A0AAU7PSR2_9FIRM
MFSFSAFDGASGYQDKKAYRGEVDYIITKPISRLSRNVLDTLTIIRSLKAKGINIYFEKENLNSLEAEKEIDIAFNGVLAQEESRNLNENVQWGYKRKFERGDDFVGKMPMGYKRDNDEWIVVPEEADIIRKISKCNPVEADAIADWCNESSYRFIELADDKDKIVISHMLFEAGSFGTLLPGTTTWKEWDALNFDSEEFLNKLPYLHTQHTQNALSNCAGRDDNMTDYEEGRKATFDVVINKYVLRGL